MGLNNETECTRFFPPFPSGLTVPLLKVSKFQKENLKYIRLWTAQICGLVIFPPANQGSTPLVPFPQESFSLWLDAIKVPGYFAATVSIQTPFVLSNSSFSVLSTLRAPLSVSATVPAPVKRRRSVQGVINFLGGHHGCPAWPPLRLRAAGCLSLSFLADRAEGKEWSSPTVQHTSYLSSNCSAFFCVSASCPAGPEQWSLRFSMSQRRLGTITRTLSQVRQ